LLVVFLCLAALYESWAVPVAVMLVVPLGIVGAVLAATMRGLVNDIYFQWACSQRWVSRRRTQF
jgi:multidrug efflux pump